MLGGAAAEAGPRGSCDAAPGRHLAPWRIQAWTGKDSALPQARDRQVTPPLARVPGCVRAKAAPAKQRVCTAEAARLHSRPSPAYKPTHYLAAARLGSLRGEGRPTARTFSAEPRPDCRSLGSETRRTVRSAASPSSADPVMRRRTIPSQEPLLGVRCTSTSGMGSSSGPAAQQQTHDVSQACSAGAEPESAAAFCRSAAHARWSSKHSYEQAQGAVGTWGLLCALNCLPEGRAQL